MKLNDYIYYYPESGMIDCNTYLVKDERAIIIDTGFDRNLPVLIDAIKRDGIDPNKTDLIVNTHLHLDHIWANNEFKAAYGGRMEMAPIQKEHYKTSAHDAARFFGIEPIDITEDGFFDETIDLGNISLEVIQTPGHSPDSLCFYCPECKALISGDLIFDHNTGRSDLPGGNGTILKQSIENVSELEIELLLPGHMGFVEGKAQVEENFDFVRRNVFPML